MAWHPRWGTTARGPIRIQALCSYYNSGTYLQDYGSADYYNLTLSTPLTLYYALGVAGDFSNASTLTANGKTITVAGTGPTPEPSPRGAIR
jgi:hypothetical protein